MTSPCWWPSNLLQGPIMVQRSTTPPHGTYSSVYIKLVRAIIFPKDIAQPVLMYDLEMNNTLFAPSFYLCGIANIVRNICKIGFTGKTEKPLIKHILEKGYNCGKLLNKRGKKIPATREAGRISYYCVFGGLKRGNGGSCC